MRQPPPYLIKDLLLPINLRHGEQLQAGEEYPRESSLRIAEWSSELLDGLIDWLKTRDFARLGQLIQSDPWLIAHPAVFHQLMHLRRLTWRSDEALSNAAEHLLQQLVECWTHAMLGDQWTLKPPPKRPGRKLSNDEEGWRSYLLDSYERLLRLLKEEKEVRQRKGESDAQWVDRLSEIIARTWSRSDISDEFYNTPQPPGSNAWISMSVRKLPPPIKIIRGTARDIATSDAAAVRDQIAYALIGYRWNLRPDQVRGRVQAARR